MSSIPQQESFDEEEESCANKHGSNRSKIQNSNQNTANNVSAVTHHAGANISTTSTDSSNQKPLVPPRNSSLADNAPK